ARADARRPRARRRARRPPPRGRAAQPPRRPAPRGRPPGRVHGRAEGRGRALRRDRRAGEARAGDLEAQRVVIVPAPRRRSRASPGGRPAPARVDGGRKEGAREGTMGSPTLRTTPGTGSPVQTLPLTIEVTAPF